MMPLEGTKLLRENVSKESDDIFRLGNFLSQSNEPLSPLSPIALSQSLPLALPFA